MKLLALILAYLVSHLVNKPQRYRQFGWFHSWEKWLTSKVNWAMHELLVIVIIAIPVFLISVVLLGLTDSSIGSLLVSILVLSYCIGPESLQEDVASGDIRSRMGVRKNAKISLLIKKMTQRSLSRWFGVFFWYVVLGIVGALIYRLSERLDFHIKDGEETKPTIKKLMKILNYPVSWMMVISLAIASDFERVYKKCKSYMTMKNVETMDNTFLYEAADFAVENCEVESEDEVGIEVVTINVLKRMLLVWLVFVSVLVILAV